MDNNKQPAPSNEPENDGAKMSPEQQKHHDALYNYKRDEEGTLDTSDRLDQETVGIPDDTVTPGADPGPTTGDPVDNIIVESNNPIDDNNR